MNNNNHIITTGGQELDLSTPAVMAIINVTPDSFWEGGRCGSNTAVISASVNKAVEEGASILDVGGYSSRPGADDVSQEEEYTRLSAAMDIIRENHPDAIVSLDTFRSCVAGKIIEKYGPCMINDISAGELDPEMIPTVASLGVPYIAMHMRGTPKDMQTNTGYRNIVAEVTDYLTGRALLLREQGVRHIILDPGFGFAKTSEQNHILLNGLDKVCALGYPVLSGISRKSMIYKPLGTTPSEALTGTIALNWESLCKGASILRVHDVKEAVDTLKLYNFHAASIKQQDNEHGKHDRG